MPIHRRPMLRLGGEAAFAAYQREFDRLYRAGPVTDVLGRQVVFPRDACEHVCFKDQRVDRWYWDAARLKGPRLYPPPKPKRRR